MMTTEIMGYSSGHEREGRIRQRISLMLLAWLLMVTVSFVPAQPPPPQDPLPPEPPEILDFSSRPIFVNLYLFQLEVQDGKNEDLTDQIFRMRTASLSEHDKWMRTFRKIYPGSEISLLKQESRRVFRTSKSVTVPITRTVNGRSFSLELNGAQSPGDGVTPGTSLVTILNMQFGSDAQAKPISYGIVPLEVEHGMTYFYLAKQLQLQGSDYTRFVRPQEPVDRFQNRTYYLLLAMSVDLDVTETPARLIDERQSIRFQEGAIKKTPLTVPEAVEKAGLSGMVRVQVEIQPTGTVSRTNVTYSTLP
ncbi:MAG: hypothetical protein ACO394_08755, partial [Blastocatellia bacterium]